MIFPVLNQKGQTVGYVRETDRGDFYGYMTYKDAKANRYCVGMGTEDDAINGISKIIAEMKAEQAFERRYA